MVAIPPTPKLTISPVALAAFVKQTRSWGDDVVEAAGKACYEEAEAIIVDSVPLVPWRDGILKGSHFVEPPVHEGGRVVSVRFGYGGAANAYAYVQHEHEEFVHPKGGQAKYLTTAIEQHEQNLEERFKAFMEEHL